ncbi:MULTISPECIES: extracellular solute-binding protein [Streptomyces]|uniref:ABC transporter substrate-binding protein n=1 Tax=Streptomyces TaxID=1883 RepID=UPI0014885FE4|nr:MULTISPECIES: extracellular solute-binding protein [Streptomyces]
MKFRSVLVGIAAALSLLSAGCGSSGSGSSENLPKNAADAGGMDALVAKAKEEGEVSLYAATTEKSTTAWVEHFEKKYGIQVKLYRDGSTTLFQKWAQEVSGGVDNADIVIQNVYQLWQDAEDKGWITDYRTANYGGYDFAKVLPGTGLTGLVYPLHQSIGAVVWNTKVTTPEQEELLREDPLAAMTDPSFKGQIALGDTGGATTAGNYANVILHQSDKYGWKWLQGVADNDPALFESQIPIAEQLVKGEYAVTFGTDTLYNDYIADGASIEYAYPKPTNAALWMIGLPTATPHPYAARLFMEWATSDEGHDLMAGYGTGTGTRTGWADERAIAKEPWYAEPEVWYGMATQPELQGDGFADFVSKVNATLGK